MCLVNIEDALDSAEESVGMRNEEERNNMHLGQISDKSV